MQTRKALKALSKGEIRYSGDPVGPLAERADQYRQAYEDRENQIIARKNSDTLMKPVLDALKRKVAKQASEQDRATPIAMRFDAFQTVKTIAEQGDDRGIAHLARHLEQEWHKDPMGSITLGEMMDLRAHYVNSYPKSKVAKVIDREIPKVGYSRLPVAKLARIAAKIEDQADFEHAIVAAGLQGDRHDQVQARTLIRELVALRGVGIEREASMGDDDRTNMERVSDRIAQEMFEEQQEMGLEDMGDEEIPVAEPMEEEPALADGTVEDDVQTMVPMIEEVEQHILDTAPPEAEPYIQLEQDEGGATPGTAEWGFAEALEGHESPPPSPEWQEEELQEHGMGGLDAEPEFPVDDNLPPHLAKKQAQLHPYEDYTMGDDELELEDAGYEQQDLLEGPGMHVTDNPNAFPGGGVVDLDADGLCPTCGDVALDGDFTPFCSQQCMVEGNGVNDFEQEIMPGGPLSRAKTAEGMNAPKPKTHPKVTTYAPDRSKDGGAELTKDETKGVKEGQYQPRAPLDRDTWHEGPGKYKDNLSGDARRFLLKFKDIDTAANAAARALQQNPEDPKLQAISEELGNARYYRGDSQNPVVRRGPFSMPSGRPSHKEQDQRFKTKVNNPAQSGAGLGKALNLNPTMVEAALIDRGEVVKVGNVSIHLNDQDEVELWVRDSGRAANLQHLDTVIADFLKYAEEEVNPNVEKRGGFEVITLIPVPCARCASVNHFEPASDTKTGVYACDCGHRTRAAAVDVMVRHGQLEPNHVLNVRLPKHYRSTVPQVAQNILHKMVTPHVREASINGCEGLEVEFWLTGATEQGLDRIAAALAKAGIVSTQFERRSQMDPKSEFEHADRLAMYEISGRPAYELLPPAILAKILGGQGEMGTQFKWDALTLREFEAALFTLNSNVRSTQSRTRDIMRGAQMDPGAITAPGSADMPVAPEMNQQQVQSGGAPTTPQEDPTKHQEPDIQSSFAHYKAMGIGFIEAIAQFKKDFPEWVENHSTPDLDAKIIELGMQLYTANGGMASNPAGVANQTAPAPGTQSAPQALQAGKAAFKNPQVKQQQPDAVSVGKQPLGKFDEKADPKAMKPGVKVKHTPSQKSPTDMGETGEDKHPSSLDAPKPPKDGHVPGKAGDQPGTKAPSKGMHGKDSDNDPKKSVPVPTKFGPRPKA